MRNKKDTTNFSAPIPTDLKDRIDKTLETADIPIGKAVRALAEWLGSMTPEQVRMFVYGPGQETFESYIQRQVVRFLDSKEGQARLEALVTELIAASDAGSK